MPNTAMIFDIQHFSVSNGPGIRTTVFFKGCPLRCRWCHNPESLLSRPQIMLTDSKCVHCGACSDICPSGCHAFEQGIHVFNSESCISCGYCVKACMYDSLRLTGRTFTVDEVFAELSEEAELFELSDGGITLSGGECLMQADFCESLLIRCCEHSLHTAVDTCGYVPRDVLRRVVPYTSLFLYDIKAIDEKVHIHCTGVSNHLILDNLCFLESLGCNIEVRVPYIPGWNDDQMPKIAAFLSTFKSPPSVRVLPYHNYAASKYKSLGLTHALPEVLPTDIEIEAAQQLFSW